MQQIDEIFGMIKTATPFPLLVTDLETDEIVDANTAAAELLARPIDELKGVRLKNIYPPNSTFGTPCERADKLRNADNWVTMNTFDDGTSIVIQRPDGTNRPVEIMVREIEIDNRRFGITVLQDLSGTRRREQRLSVLHRILRHNIRNDMNIIRGYAEILQDQSPDGDTKATTAILEKADALLNVAQKTQKITDILDNDNFDVSHVPLLDLITRGVSQVKSEYPEATIQVDCSADAEVRNNLIALEVAFENILENAFKHNNDQEARAWVSVKSFEAGVEISIDDNGPGISEHDRRLIKQDTETPLLHGVGVGLWLVNWATDIAEGDIFFEPTSEGTRVILWFPSVTT